MGNYLADRRKALGLTQKEIAELVDVSEATVSRWESGEIANMRRDRIAAYAKALKTTPSFIMTGDSADKELPAGATPYNAQNVAPLLGTVRAGMPMYAEENIEDYIPIRQTDGAKYFWLNIRGDSMNAAGMDDGDQILVREQPEVENGQIAAVRIGEEATLKHFYYQNDVMTLLADNSSVCPPMVYTGPQLEEVEVEGLAVGFCRGLV